MKGVTDSLVLAGGGTKAAFEVGALLYLTRHGDYAPGIIAGTSAGAMIAATLAQGTGGQQTRDLARVVHRNVLAVSDMNAVFGRQPWLQHIEGTPFAAVFDEILAQASRPKTPLELGPDADGRGRTSLRRKRALMAMSTALGHAPRVVRAGRSFLTEGGSPLSLEPLGAALRGERDAGIAAIDEALVAGSGSRLRLALAALGDGVARYVTESGEMVEADSVTLRPSGGRPGVIEGVLASSSVPLVFPPRRLGDDVYCDGGVVQTVPLAAAVRAGAGHVTALLASPLYKPRDDVDYANASLMAIYSRAVAGVAQLEAIRANLRYPLADGAELLVIAPTIEVVGTFEVSPGLIGIAVDYGWLRAAESTAGLPRADAQALGGLSDALAALRARAWKLEEQLLHDGPSDEVERTLAQVRLDVAGTAAAWARAGLEPPERLAECGTVWEVHRGGVPDELRQLGGP